VTAFQVCKVTNTNPEILVQRGSTVLIIDIYISKYVPNFSQTGVLLKKPYAFETVEKKLKNILQKIWCYHFFFAKFRYKPKQLKHATAQSIFQQVTGSRIQR
jgi:hypothetical protein